MGNWGWLTGRSGGSRGDYPIDEGGEGTSYSYSEDGSYQASNYTCPKEGFPIILFIYNYLNKTYCNSRGSLGDKCKGCPYNP